MMKQIILIMTFGCITAAAFAQAGAPKRDTSDLEPSLLAPETASFEDTNKVFQFVEQMPEFPGGQAALNDYLTKNIKYPELARENGIEGKVVIRFVVDEEGNVKEAKVIKSAHAMLDKEALRVVNAMPKWKPGKQNGRAVKTAMTLPVSFKLQ